MSRNMQELHDTVEKCCAILSRTNDGDDLEPQHLRLIELAVNGHLNSKGIQALHTLYAQVMAGDYVKPYFHGVEHMTRDHEGYVYYKGVCVEHYTPGWADSLDAKNDLLKLRDKCGFLERNGVPPNQIFVMEQEYGEERARQFYELLGRHGEGAGVSFSHIVIENNCGRAIDYLSFRPSPMLSVLRHDIVRDFASRFDNDGFEITVRTYHIGGESDVSDNAVLESLTFCFEHMLKRKNLNCLDVQKWRATEGEIFRLPKHSKGKKPRRQER